MLPGPLTLYVAQTAQRSANELQREAQRSKAESSDLQRQLLETQQQQLRESHALMTATQVPLQLAREAAAMANYAVGQGPDGRRMSMSQPGGAGRHAMPDDEEVDVDGDLNESMLRSPGGAKPRGIRSADDEARRRERECVVVAVVGLCRGPPY